MVKLSNVKSGKKVVVCPRTPILYSLLHLYILENNLPMSHSACEAREDSWIIKLDTRSPNGLNLELNEYGNLDTLFFKVSNI